MMKRPAYRSSNMIQYDEYDYPHNILASYSKKKKKSPLTKTIQMDFFIQFDPFINI